MNLIATKVLEKNLLKENGYLIIEHPSMKKIDNHTLFIEQRKYGSSSFSFFGGNQ
jgi:16S rRNA G966 N2-methylase RsmD